MNDDKLLTVSIAAYNMSSYIGETLESLLLPEEYMNLLDIIIVNDGSKDDTAEVAGRYAERFPYSIRLVSKENGGYGSTINTSVKLARGKYFKLLDGDDWFHTEHLSDYLDYLENATADLVFSPYSELYEDTKDTALLDKHTAVPELSTALSDVLISKGVAHHEMAIKTESLQKIFHSLSEHCLYTDIEYNFLCLLCAQTFSRFSKPVYRYRMGRVGQSVSVESTQKHCNDKKIVTQEVCRWFAEYEDILEEKKKQLLERAVNAILHDTYIAYLLNGNNREKKQELMEFDRDMRAYPSLYKWKRQSWVVKLTRFLHFNFYWLLCTLVRMKHGLF